VILGPNDDSSSVEAALAVRHGKPIGLMSLGKKRPRRVVAGLPGVLETVMIKPEELPQQAQHLVMRLIAQIQSRKADEAAKKPALSFTSG
jgi:hypothetical protein